jgi:hypothetical protein
MKLNQNFELRSICGENVLIPCGQGGVDLNYIIHLNETGVFLWNEAQKGDFDKQSLVAALLNEYEVSEEMANKDVEAFVGKLVENKMAFD